MGIILSKILIFVNIIKTVDTFSLARQKVIQYNHIFMSNSKILEWVLRFGVAGEFLGHGVFALQGKAAWLGWIKQLTGVPDVTASWMLLVVGLLDILVAIIVLFRPIRLVLLWATLWGFWTALIRPLVGEPIWDFIERWANWAAPLALFFHYGRPRTLKEWFWSKFGQ